MESLCTTEGIAFFSWSVAFAIILTTDNMRKRGDNYYGLVLYVQEPRESVAHLFLHCDIA